MPDAKKPRKTAAKPAARKATTKKTTSKKTAAKKSATRRAARPRPAARAKRDEETAGLEEDAVQNDDQLERDAPEQDEAAAFRPVAIAGSRSAQPTSTMFDKPDETAAAGTGPPLGSDPFAASGIPTGSPESPEPRPTVENARTEAAVGLLALLLGLSAFLPWYEVGVREVSGWTSGTFGPLVAFLGFGGAAIIALRLLGRAIAFPVSYALTLEGIGWLAVFALLLKRFARPEGWGVVGFSFNLLEAGFWLALIAAVGTALLASKLSRDLPVVVLPGWFRSVAGKTGGVLIAIMLIGSVAFGVTNEYDPTAGFGSTVEGIPEVVMGQPKCIDDLKFPVPNGLTPTQGVEPTEPNLTCTAIYETNLSPNTAAKRFERDLKAAGWAFQKLGSSASAGAHSYAISAPACGQVQILSTADTRTVYILLGSDDLCAGLGNLSRGTTPNDQ